MNKLPASDIERLINVAAHYKTWKGFADSIGRSPRTVRRWIREGRIPPKSHAEIVTKVQRRERYYEKRDHKPVRELPRYHTLSEFNFNRYLPTRIYAFDLANAIEESGALQQRIHEAVSQMLPFEFTVTIRKGANVIGVVTHRIETYADYDELISDVYDALVQMYGTYGGAGSGLTLTIDR